MRLTVSLILLVFVGLWLDLMAFLTGSLPMTWLPIGFSGLKLPESKDLADLRDSLLPKLLGGKLVINEHEA